MAMKIMTIGDVHGRDTWKFLTHGSSYEFQQWSIMIAEGADPCDELFKGDYPYMDVDKIVFIGDYVDSFTISNVEIKKNLEDIILFKKALPDKVVLLWGNHDVQYFIPNQICSGYRPEARWDLQILFDHNKDLFQMAYQIDEYLWTHAGLLKPVLADMLKMYPELKEFKTEMDILNHAFEREIPQIFQVDGASGGWSMYGGPLWVRPKQLEQYGLKLNQIVGHTPQKKLTEIEIGHGYKIWLTDYIEYNEESDIVPFILEI
jgi:predicted MPP superfamily phosphohydrolase